MRRDVAIEIAVPTEGLHYEAPASIITPRSSPNLLANAYYGAVQKEYGTSLYCTGTVPAPVNGIFEAKFSDSTILEVFTHTGMYKYGAGTFASDGQVYAGTFTDFWSYTMHNDDMFYTNGVELVQAKLTSAATGTNSGAVTTGSYKSGAVVSFKEHLCLYNVTESGNASPKRVRWSKAGLLGHTASDFSTGLANFVDVQDIEGKIINALPLGGGTVVVYGEGTIHIQEWVGGTSVFLFTKMIENIEIPAVRGIVGNDSVHYLLTRDNVYEYKGGRSMNPIGDPIRKNMLSSVHPDHMNKSFLEYTRETDELRVWIPTTGSYPNVCYICKVRDNYSWFKVERHATAPGKFKGGTSITIGELVGNIGAQNYVFGDLQATAEAPVYLSGQSDGRVAKRDITRYSIIASGTSVPQTFLFDSKVLTSIQDIDPLVRKKYNLSAYKDNDSRWIKTQIEAKGEGSLHVGYSTDEGVSFTTFPESPKTLASEWDIYEFDCDIAAPSFMVRITNTATNEFVAVDYVKVSFVPGADSI